MSYPAAPFLSPAARLFCAAAALVATCVLAAALLASWQQGAEPQWLAATPEVLAEVAACEQGAQRLERLRCKQRIVAARTGAETRAVPLASR